MCGACSDVARDPSRPKGRCPAPTSPRSCGEQRLLTPPAAGPRSPSRRSGACGGPPAPPPPRSCVSSRSAAASASLSPGRSSGVTSALSVITSRSSGRVTTSRARRTTGCRRTSSARWLGCTNSPRTFVDWSARPIQPRIRTFVRPHGLCPGRIAERSPVAKRSSGWSADRTRHHHLPHLARRNRIAGPRADDLQDDLLVQHQPLHRRRLVRDEPRVRRPVPLEDLHARARPAPSEATPATPPPSPTPWSARTGPAPAPLLDPARP